MNLWDVAMIGAGLSMDAFAVSISNEMVYRGLTRVKRYTMPALFSIFQVVMPMMGCCVGGLFTVWIDRYAGILILCILGFIGGKMLWDGCHPENVEETMGDLPGGVLLLQAAATSIDAFAVGVGFSAIGIPLVPACSLIGAITFVLCGTALVIGRAFGNLLEDKAQAAGGIVLIIIGLKSFLA
jgi:putative Mn2+ efflux pump MntP